MVLDKNLKPLHQLSKQGEEAYNHFLEVKADEILFKHQHPFKWAVEKAKEIFDN